MFDSLWNLCDSIDYAFADDATKDEFADFRWKYPWATYTDWWDYQAHVKSRGALPNPMHSQDWAYRRAAYTVLEPPKPPANPANPANPTPQKPNW